MNSQESIYNIVPKEIIFPPKEELYKSRYLPTISPTATTFGLHTTSFPNIANLNGDFNLPRGAHPVKQMYAQFGKPNGTNRHDPNNFIKKGHQYRMLPERNFNVNQPKKLDLLLRLKSLLFHLLQTSL